MTLRTLAASAAALTASLTALAPAAMAGEDGYRSETLEYRLGDLARPAAYADLQREVQRAARRVCRVAGVRGVQEWSAQRECTEAAFDRAVAQLDRRLASLDSRQLAALDTIERIELRVQLD